MGNYHSSDSDVYNQAEDDSNSNSRRGNAGHGGERAHLASSGATGGANAGGAHPAAVPHVNDVTITMAELNKVACKLTDFNPDRAELWFRRTEGVFELAGIKEEKTKFLHAAAAMRGQVEELLAEHLLNPQGETPYTTLKEEAIKAVTPSDSAKIAKLEAMTLGDLRPTLLLRLMNNNKPDTDSADSAVFREMFIRKMPLTVRKDMYIQKSMTIKQLAELGDAHIEAMRNTAKSANVNQVMIASYEEPEQDYGLGEINAVGDGGGGGRGGRGGARGGRGGGRAIGSGGDAATCWFHRRFGDKAFKCGSPTTCAMRNVLAKQTTNGSGNGRPSH